MAFCATSTFVPFASPRINVADKRKRLSSRRGARCEASKHAVAASTSKNRRCVLLGAVALSLSSAIQDKAVAMEDGDNALIQELLRKSAENKEKNDAERKNYDRQYASYMSIVKGSGYIPETKEKRAKLGVERPAECNLPIFNTTPLCLDFDRLAKE
ncbi:hypothetical protein CYMTET_51115 [Cymbomonas tetramitiformis]|uniref:Uncharacterized protein n=1 Tax=Cymbomonas tetramitiformis TaxID=36881 RepID=A0AAE0ESZ4_9CHLO|nr:hypothetical protein CYMTET_51115 [Cymbomonas tetramitiformis]